MHSTLSIASALAVLAGQTLAVTHMVMTDGIAFSPSSVSNVASGDEISVTFSTQIPHNIISSTFDAPCTYNPAGGVASLTYKKGEVFVFKVNSTDPQWFYCSVGDHCNDGMVFAINPSSTETVEEAQNKAANADITLANNDVAIGGAVGGSGSSSGDMSGMSGMSMTSGSMTMTMEMSSMPSMASTMTMASGGMSMSTGAAGGGAGSGSTGKASGSGAMATGGSMTSSAAPASQTGGAATVAGGSVALAGALLAGAAAFAL
ncbi:hypothetical protein TI39_contig915g00001 [Zymoseptoria brevis]|uniref:Extracellular serine-rich protein n=1 Tax=Zymoseptoria brevis TaxID=1047168 RepID=A0A0F4GI73_9PEZI|nr:hypothetical protein TI39_contig915g00001 [Zymoseptoria brevis]